MSKTREKIPERVVERWAITAVTCDCCGRKIEDEHGLDASPDWSPDKTNQVADLSRSEWAGSERIKDEVDLCYLCAGFLIEKIRNGEIRRPEGQIARMDR